MKYTLKKKRFRYLISLACTFSLVQAHSHFERQEIQSFGNFIRARSISVDPQGNIFIADAGAHKIQKFDPEKNLLAEIGGYGWGSLEFDQPYDVCASNGLDVFVADYGNHRIQRFDRKLEYIATLYTRENNDEFQRFGYPVGVNVNRFGDLFICETENRRVLKVSRFNRVVRSIGGIDAGKGRLFDPRQIEVDANDNIYVLEHNRIVAFDNFGNYVRTIGENLFRTATGFTLYQSSIYVADSSRVLELNLDGRFLNTINCSDIVSHPSEQECVDVAANASNLIVLFRHTAVVLTRQ